MAVEASMRTFFRVIWNRKPVKLFQDVIDQETGQVKILKENQIEMMTKLCRKSWYAELINRELYLLDPSSRPFKTILKAWVNENIPKDGDTIFKGKIKTRIENERDWLTLELENWKSLRDLDEECLVEVRQYI